MIWTICSGMKRRSIIPTRTSIPVGTYVRIQEEEEIEYFVENTWFPSA